MAPTLTATVTSVCLSLPVLRAQYGAAPRRLPRNLIARQRLSREQQTRTFLSLFKKKTQSPDESASAQKSNEPTLSQGNLFHPFSKSPFPTLRKRSEIVRKIAPCPVCVATHEPGQRLKASEAAKFDCPDCGWPTHCSHEHWQADGEHHKYCGRLREANEDEHDLRSGRKMKEFDLPGPMDYDETVSFANWDVFWYTRGFPSMDTERMRRHASKLHTYPMTIASVLHRNSGLTTSNQRVTPEGIRSLAAIRSILHPPTGAPETEEASVGKPVFRIFVLGARAESSLPPHVWEQLSLLFPAVSLHVHFIGPQVSLPEPKDVAKAKNAVSNEDYTADTTSALPRPEKTASASGASGTDASTSDKDASKLPSKQTSSSSVPDVYEPSAPPPLALHKHMRSSVAHYGAPSYTLPYVRQLSVTGIRTNYPAVHQALFDSLDPYTDVFFFFMPGFGFPSPSGGRTPSGEPELQISSPTEWGDTLPLLLQTKCAVFVTGFSPADVERDVRALAQAEGVSGEFDWIITPGENQFGSEKWEVADFDPRVMMKPNWGIWGIRGKRRDIKRYEG